MSIINIEQLGIKKWTVADLQKPENFELLESLVNDFALAPMVGDAFQLHLALEEVFVKQGSTLKQRNSTLYNKYQDLLRRLKILSLPDQKLEDIEHLLKHDLNYIFKSKIPILSLLTGFLRWDRASFWYSVAGFIKFLKENEEKLGSEEQQFSIGKAKPPTIGDWINDYIIFTEGRPSKMDELSQTSYFTTSDNVKKLNKEEKLVLKRVIKLFKIFANIDNHLSYYRDAALYDEEILELEPEEPEEEVVVPQIDKINKVRKLYQGELKKLWEKYKIDEGLKEFGKQSLSQLLGNLRLNLNRPEKLLPILISINKQKEPCKALASSPTLLELYNRQALLEFKVKPESFNPGYFYKLILTKAKLSEAEAAVFLQYLTKFNKDLVGVVYDDFKTNSFKWREVKLENNKIIIK